MWRGKLAFDLIQIKPSSGCRQHLQEVFPNGNRSKFISIPNVDVPTPKAGSLLDKLLRGSAPPETDRAEQFPRPQSVSTSIHPASPLLPLVPRSSRTCR